MIAAAGVGSTALFAGGHDGSVDSGVIDIYDGATDTWSTAKLSELRTGVVATTVGTKVLIAGGCLNDSCSRLSKVVDIYDTATGTWTTAALSEGRDNLAATRIGSKVFLAYGPGAVVEIYDDSTGAWSTAPLSLERVGLVATSVGSKAFFAGGQIGKYRADSGRVDIYDASTDTWRTAKLSRTGGADLAAGTIGTKVFFADGPRGIVDIYDDSTGTWNTATLSQRRHGLAMAIVGTKAFFAGGHDLSQYSDVVDVYDASTGDWTTTTLSEGRLLPVAGSAGTAVVVAGGNADRNISGVVDTFDTATDAWTDAGSNLRRLLRDLRGRGNPNPPCGALKGDRYLIAVRLPTAQLRLQAVGCAPRPPAGPPARWPHGVSAALHALACSLRQPLGLLDSSLDFGCLPCLPHLRPPLQVGARGWVVEPRPVIIPAQTQPQHRAVALQDAVRRRGQRDRLIPPGHQPVAGQLRPVILTILRIEAPVFRHADAGIEVSLPAHVLWPGARRADLQHPIRRLAHFPGQVELALPDGLSIHAEGQVHVRGDADIEVGGVVADDRVAAEEGIGTLLEVGEPTGKQAEDGVDGPFLIHCFRLEDQFVGIEVESGVVNLALPVVGPHGRRGYDCRAGHGESRSRA